MYVVVLFMCIVLAKFYFVHECMYVPFANNLEYVILNMYTLYLKIEIMHFSCTCIYNCLLIL